MLQLSVWCEKCVAARHYSVIGKQLLFANNRNRVRWVFLCLSQDEACTDLFENFSENSLKGDLSSNTTLNPSLFSLVNTFKMLFFIFLYFGLQFAVITSYKAGSSWVHGPFPSGRKQDTCSWAYSTKNASLKCLYPLIFSYNVYFIPSVWHVTGNDQDYLRKIPRVVVQISALL